MNVYFNKSFAEHVRRGNPGTKLSLDIRTNWDSTVFLIPAAYSCKKGLVIDLCTPVSSKIPIKLKKRSTERPASLNFKASVIVNGQELPYCSMYSVVWNPVPPTGKGTSGAFDCCRDPDAENLLEAYGCSRETGWHFIRISFPWQETGKPEIQSLELRLTANPVPHCGARFTTAPGCSEQNVTVRHPVTDCAFDLTIKDFHWETMPENMNRGNSSFEFPSHYGLLTYSISPEPVPGEFRLQDCEDSDSPRGRDKKGSAAYAIGVIGGADGPSFLSLHSGSEDGAKKSSSSVLAFSSLHYKPLESVQWQSIFYIKERENLFIRLIGC